MRFLHNFRIPLFVLGLIIIELIFKFNVIVGFYLYLAGLIGGLIYLTLRYEKFISVLLILPLVRIVGIAVPLSPDTKLLFISALLLMLVILLGERFSFGFRKKKEEIIFIGASLVGGSLIGLFLSQYVAPWPTVVVIAGLCLAAISEELYFRLSLLKFQKTLGMVIVISLLYAIVVFDVSFMVSFAAFVFSFLAGFFYVKYNRAYIPVLAHIALNIFLIVPRFF